MLAEDSHAKSYLYLLQKIRKMSQKLSSAAVVIGALRVKPFFHLGKAGEKLSSAVF